MGGGVRGKRCLGDLDISFDSSSLPPVIIMSCPFGIVFGYSDGELGKHLQGSLIIGTFLRLVLQSHAS